MEKRKKIMYNSREEIRKWSEGEGVMRKIPTSIPDLYVIEPEVFGDERGWFYESWSEREFLNMGLSYHFVQDNQSYSKEKGTLRGLHFQKGEAAQAKLVRCLRGRVLDVAVDLRKASSTFLKWAAVELSEENKKMLLIPRGFAHGFLTLTEDVVFAYKADGFYQKEAEGCLRFDDEAIGIDWGLTKEEKEGLILSEKDRMAPTVSAASEDSFFSEFFMSHET